MTNVTSQTQLQTKTTSLPASGILQRKCACGNHTVAGGECRECGKKKNSLQRKLTIGASNDPLEQEADRVAEQVLAAPAHSAINGSPPRIQRFAGQPAGAAEIAPTSVDRVLEGSGRPLDLRLRQDMEQRFGHDFSRVRVHSGAVAEQSARDVNAHAYTVGHSIVFGAGKFAPGTHQGRRLIAHELTHVVQQSGLGPNNATKAADNDTGGIRRLQRQPEGVHGSTSPASANRAMRDEVRSEKWSEQVEAIYRLRGDPRADAVARCRTQGAAVCAWLLTPAEVDALHSLAGKAKGDENTIHSGMKNAAPVLGLLGPLPLVKTTSALVPAVGPTTVAPAAAGPGGAAAGATVAAPAVMVAYLVLAGYTLYKLGQFQQGLRERGFIILDDALAACIGGCHFPKPPKASPRWGEFDLAPTPSMQKPMDFEKLRPWLDQAPPTYPKTTPKLAPKPIPKPDADFDDEDTERRCHSMAVGQRGGNSCHDRFSTLVSGSPREWGVETPEGQFRDFDGLGHGRMLYEVKTGYRFLLGNARSTQQMRANTMARFVKQSSAQSRIAKRCGYSLLWVFNDKLVADFVSGFIEPKVISKKYDCDEDA